MYFSANETNGRGERGQSVRLGRRVLRLDRLDRRGPRRRRDGRRSVHAAPRRGDVRAAPLRILARVAEPDGAEEAKPRSGLRSLSLSRRLEAILT